MALFKSEKGKSEILDLYNEKLESLNIKYENKLVDTAYGKTNIIVCGNPLGEPIILIHGSNGCAPVAIETYFHLLKSYRIYAVDVIAQPNKSSENRPSMKDLSYGKWMYEVMEQLQINEVTMAGFSFGGLVILKTLEFNQTRVKAVFLTAPAYIVNGNPLKALFKVFISIKRYIKTKKPKYVEQFLDKIFTEKDPFALKYLSKVFLVFNLDFTPIPVISSKSAKLIATPITLFASEKDLLFPGKKMLKRASKIFPSLKKMELIKNAKHVQSKEQNQVICSYILNNKSL